MNKTFWLVIFLVIIAIGLAVWEEKGKKEINIEVNQQNQGNILDLSSSSISETNNFYNIKVEYPQFKNVDPAFNQKISSLITGEIDAFKKDSKDNWEARRATAPPDNPVPENPPTPFDFIASWTPTQLNNKYLSFVINIYYYSGGAHGITEVDTFNYDLIAKKEISITDFLGSSQSALEKLSQLSSAEITSKIESGGVTIDDNLKQMISQGTQPTTDNYQNFNFNYNSLTIYFQQYQVAPGYIGPVIITFFKDTLVSNSTNSEYLK